MEAAALRSRVRTRWSGSARLPEASREEVKNWSACSVMPALTKTASIRENLSCAAAKAARWAGQEVMSQVWTRRCEAGCVKVGGGGCRSTRTRLWCGLRVERRVAVARPIPEEPPVIRIVFGVEFGDVRVEREGSKRAIVVAVGCCGMG